MQLQPVHHLQRVEVPDDDVGLSKSVSEVRNSNIDAGQALRSPVTGRRKDWPLASGTYLETHVCLLARGDVLAGLRDLNHGDVVVVSLEEAGMRGRADLP